MQRTEAGASTTVFLGELFEYEVETGAGLAWIFAAGERIAYKGMDQATLRAVGPAALLLWLPDARGLIPLALGGGALILVLLFATGRLEPPRRPQYAGLALALGVLLAAPPPCGPEGPRPARSTTAGC